MAIKNEAPALMAIHPGSILKEELMERGISQKDFAKRIKPGKVIKIAQITSVEKLFNVSNFKIRLGMFLA